VDLQGQQRLPKGFKQYLLVSAILPKMPWNSQCLRAGTYMCLSPVLCTMQLALQHHLRLMQAAGLLLPSLSPYCLRSEQPPKCTRDCNARHACNPQWIGHVAIEGACVTCETGAGVYCKIELRVLRCGFSRQGQHQGFFSCLLPCLSAACSAGVYIAYEGLE